MPHNALSLFSTLYFKSKLYSTNVIQTDFPPFYIASIHNLPLLWLALFYLFFMILLQHHDLNRSAYLGSVLNFEVLTSVFTWSLEVFDPNWPLLCPAAEPLPLMELCRRAARQALGRHRIHHIQSLPLPQTLKNYLQYQWETQTHTAKKSPAFTENSQKWSAVL